MQCAANGTKDLVHNVAFPLGSPWVEVGEADDTFTFLDDITAETLTIVKHTPPAAPLGFTNMLLGLQDSTGDYGTKVVPLVDANQLLRSSRCGSPCS